MEKELRQRRFGTAVRLEIASIMPDEEGFDNQTHFAYPVPRTTSAH